MRNKCPELDMMTAVVGKRPSSFVTLIIAFRQEWADVMTCTCSVNRLTNDPLFDRLLYALSLVYCTFQV